MCSAYISWHRHIALWSTWISWRRHIALCSTWISWRRHIDLVGHGVFCSNNLGLENTQKSYNNISTIMSHTAHIKILQLYYCATIAGTQAASAYHSSATHPYNSTKNLYVLRPKGKLNMINLSRDLCMHIWAPLSEIKQTTQCEYWWQR